MGGKLYLVCDLSTISGILWGGCGLPAWYNIRQFQNDNLRRRMTMLINETIAFALNSGIIEFVIHETCPVDLEILHSEAKLIRGAKTLYIDRTFAGIAFIGQGITKDILPDCPSRNIKRTILNGKEVDELTLFALYAGYFGVPVVLAHGEKTAFNNLLRFVPDITIHNKVDGLQANLKNKSNKLTAVIKGKVELGFDFSKPIFADFHCRFPDVHRVSKTKTVVFTENIKSAFESYCAAGIIEVIDWVR